MSDGVRIEIELDDGSFTTRMMHAGQTVEQFNRHLGGTAQSMRLVQDGGQRFLSTFRDVAVIFSSIIYIGGKLQETFGGLISDLVKTNAEMEKLGKLLQGMSQAINPAKEAAQQVKFLRDFATQAPFSLKGLTDAFVKLKAAGLDPMKGVLQGLVDGVAAFGGTEEILHRASVAIQQMSGKGVIQMEELRQQLGEAIPRAVELMARSMGVTTGELINKIGKGTVEAKTALAGLSLEFQRTFGGAAAAQMETWNGQIAKMKTLWQSLQLEAGEAGFFAAIKRQLADLNTFMASDQALGFARSVGQALASFVGYARDAVNWVIRFKDELMLVAQVMAGAFAAKVAINALLGIGSALGGLITQTRAFGMAWTAMATSVQINNIAGQVGALGLAGAGISRTTQVLRNTAAVLPIIAAGFAGISSVIIPLTAIVLGAAYAFGLFSSGAKSAYENAAKFGASTAEELEKVRQHVEALRAEYEALGRERDKVANGRTQAAAGMSVGEIDKRLAEAERKLAEGQNVLKQTEEQVARATAERMLNARQKEVTDALAVLQKRYDQEFILARTAHDNLLKEFGDNNKDTKAVRDEFMAWSRERQLRFYDDQIAELERFLQKAKDLQANGDADQRQMAEKQVTDLLARQRALMEQRAQTADLKMGVNEIAGVKDVEKAMEKARGLIDGVKSKSAEYRAEIAGVSGEYAKLAYILEQAAAKKNKLPIDNAEVAELVKQLREAQVELDALKEMVDGQSKFDRELESILESTRKENFEAMTRGKSQLDKLALAWEQGLFSGKKPTTLLQTQLGGVTTEAGKAGGAIANAFGQTNIDRGNTLLGVVQNLAGAFGLLSSNASRGVDAAARIPAAGSGGATYAGGAYVDNLIRRESSGNPNATNPDSTAEGLGQFIESTWLAFLKDMHPEHLANLSREAALDLRKNSDLMREAIVWYAQKNAVSLGKNNIPVNDANLYLAHFLGDGGAIAALSKSADTLLASIPELTAARAKNKDVFNKLATVGDLQRWAQGFMGPGSTAPTRPNMGQSSAFDQMLQSVNPQQRAMLLEIQQLIGSTENLKANNALTDVFKEIQAGQQKVIDGEDGMFKHVAAIRKRIREGEFGTDKDPDSERYKTLIEHARKWDEADKLASDHKRTRDKLRSYEESKEREAEILAQKEADLRRQYADESKFKLSNEYFRQAAQAMRQKELVEKSVGISGGLTREQADRELGEIDARLQRYHDLEVGAAVRTEQDKVNEIKKSLMTADQAREYSHELEVRRLQDLLNNTSVTAEQRAQIEKVIQEKIQMHRLATDASDPIAKKLRSYADITNNFKTAATGWMDQFSDQLATLVTTGKADFGSMVQSWLKDLAKLQIQQWMSQFAGIAGKGGGAKGGGKRAATHHTGGIAGRNPANRSVNPLAFLGAPRFHSGGFPGLARNEVPIIAMKGEEVGWPSQLAKKYGGAMNQANTWNINVNANGGTPEQNQDLADRIGKEIKQQSQKIAAEQIRQQMRPGGMLNHAGRRN